MGHINRENIIFLARSSRLYGFDKAQHWDSYQGEAPRDCSEAGQLYTQKLQNFEGSPNMDSISAYEYPNRKVPPDPELSIQDSRLYTQKSQIFLFQPMVMYVSVQKL